MIVASGSAMQFGAKPLFTDVAVKFGGGNRYGLIGANGCGKSTFMKIRVARPRVRRRARRMTYLSREAAFGEMQAMVAGAKIVRAELGAKA